MTAGDYLDVMVADSQGQRLWPVCPDCNRTIGADALPGARGLCKGCYRIELRRTGRRYRSADAVADEYRTLRDNGWSASAVPDLLGMSGAAFERAMYRLRLAGDPRVSDWQRSVIR